MRDGDRVRHSLNYWTGELPPKATQTVAPPRLAYYNHHCRVGTLLGGGAPTINLWLLNKQLHRTNTRDWEVPE